jgi:hypothetical protein
MNIFCQGDYGQPCASCCHVLLFCLNYIKVITTYCLCILRVEVPDESYTLVPADEDEGAGGDINYVSVDQDLDQSPEVCVTTSADKGKPWFKH